DDRGRAGAVLPARLDEDRLGLAAELQDHVVARAARLDRLDRRRLRRERQERDDLPEVPMQLLAEVPDRPIDVPLEQGIAERLGVLANGLIVHPDSPAWCAC